MKKTTLYIFTALLLTCAASSLLAAEPIGRIVALQGAATATGSDGMERQLALKSEIFQNDTIATAARSRLQIMFLDETVISQGESSSMTIDEYVYAPDSAQDNSTSVSMAQGVFRVITGRITQMNPDRFRVNTRMATIGIRGCDVGFRVTARGDDVYVIHLHGVESVVVQARPRVGDGEWQGLIEQRHTDPAVARQHLINVLQANRIVSITIEGEMEEREMTPEELIDLLNEVMPDAPGERDIEDSGDAGTEDGEEDAEEQDADGEADDDSVDQQEQADEDEVTDQEETEDTGETDTVEEDTDTEPHTDPVDDTVPDASDDTTTPGDDTDTGIIDDIDSGFIDDGGSFGDQDSDTITDPEPIPNPDPTPVIEDDNGTPPTPAPDQGTGGDTGGEAGGDTGNGSGNGGSSSVFTSKGGGMGWEWGVWETDGVVDSVQFTASNPISAADFQAIAAGTMFYDLAGGGDAAAVISHDGLKAFVEGSCSLFVQVGQGITPNWDGYFGMSNPNGDFLNFEAGGTIQPSGQMTGASSSYSMQVHSVPFGSGSIINETITGQLVGPGSGATPITGAVGSFFFDHGAAQVNGGFGADLSEH